MHHSLSPLAAWKPHQCTRAWRHRHAKTCLSETETTDVCRWAEMACDWNVASNHWSSFFWAVAKLFSRVTYSQKQTLTFAMIWNSCVSVDGHAKENRTEFICRPTHKSEADVSVSETIRKPPFVKAETALKNKKNMAKNDFQYGGWNYYTLQCGTIMTLVSPGDCTLQWRHVALGWHAMGFAQTFAVLEFYIWFRFWPYHRSRHVILHQSAKFLSKSDHPQHKKWRHVDFQDGDVRHLGF